MQNNVRALDIDDILNYPGRSLNRLEEEEEGGLFDGEEEGYSGSESSGEEDEGGGEVSGSRQRSAASTGTLSTSVSIRKVKVLFLEVHFLVMSFD